MGEDVGARTGAADGDSVGAETVAAVGEEVGRGIGAFAGDSVGTRSVGESPASYIPGTSKRVRWQLRPSFRVVTSESLT